MRWRIEGADRTTGKDLTFEVEAPDEQSAVHLAGKRAFIASIAPAPAPTPPAPVPRWTVEGRDRTTNQPTTIEVEAPDRHAAVRTAERTMFVTHVRFAGLEPVAPPMPPPSAPIPPADPAPSPAAVALPLSYATPATTSPLQTVRQVQPEFVLPNLSMAPNEQVFQNVQGVTVTNRRLIVLGQTYSMANVVSIRMVVGPPEDGAGKLLVWLGVIILVVGLCGAPGVFGKGLAVVLGLGAIVGGFVIMCQAAPSYYGAVATMTSGEVTLVRSSESRTAAAVVEAVNQAFVAR